MKAQCGVLLAAALLVGTAQSLVCYTCDAATNNAACSPPTTCPSTSAYCKTVVSTSGGVTAFSKSCAASCAVGTTSAGGVSTTTRCCSKDQCNYATTEAQSLVCYTCDATTNTADCNVPTICPSSNEYCMTLTATGGGVTTFSKSCQQSCAEIRPSVGSVTVSTNCCNTSLCNGAANVRLSYTMLFLAAGASALLLKAGL